MWVSAAGCKSHFISARTINSCSEDLQRGGETLSAFMQRHERVAGEREGEVKNGPAARALVGSYLMAW